ncbi:MAG TPA: glucose/galactose MFS transporter [Bacteroidales bacterium]|nr:glucose/galactose MFS transporter [Bacteroidales bacterium]
MNNQQNKYLFPLVVMAALFFLFGFITTMNNSTISFLTQAFGLDDVQRQLPNTFFFGAYILSVPVGIMLTKIGYKNGILTGLALIVAGFFASVPAISGGYYGFLSAVSVFAVGVVVLQVAAAPYVNALGDPKTAASRLTLTNALNSVATTIAPVFVSILLVTPTLAEGETLPYKAIREIVSGPYFAIGAITLVILLIMFFLKLPEIKSEEKEGVAAKTYKSSAFKYPHVWLGSLAIFLYMGIEIGISSFFPDFVRSLGVEGINAVDMLKFYWGGLMVGRLLGIFILRKYSPALILTICAIGGAVLLAASFVLSSTMPLVAIWLFLATGLFHSIMWPVIYNLSLEDLGPHAKIASGIIATSVIGAAILTPIMGVVQKATGSVILAVGALFIYYAYLVFFAQKGSKIRT